MFDNIPMLAVAKAAEMIAEKPVKDDLGALNDEVFSSMNQDCGELGCQFASVMETNISRLENIFDTKYVSKINKDTLSQAVISSFSDLDTQIPANGTMESPLNITLETVKDDIGKKDPDGGTRCQIELSTNLHEVSQRLEKAPCWKRLSKLNTVSRCEIGTLVRKEQN